MGAMGHGPMEGVSTHVTISSSVAVYVAFLKVDGAIEDVHATTLQHARFYETDPWGPWIRGKKASTHVLQKSKRFIVASQRRRTSGQFIGASGNQFIGAVDQARTPIRRAGYIPRPR